MTNRERGWTSESGQQNANVGTKAASRLQKRGPGAAAPVVLRGAGEIEIPRFLTVVSANGERSEQRLQDIRRLQGLPAKASRRRRFCSCNLLRLLFC
jgi:hypothetical protein